MTCWRLEDLFVVPALSGVCVCRKVHAAGDDDSVLRLVGDFLGSCYRQDLIARCKLGLDLKHAGRTERKRLLTAATSARWAGSITRRVDDQVALAVRCMKALLVRDRTEINRIEKRLRVPVGQGQGRVRGYTSGGERFQKQRRLQMLKAREARTAADLEDGNVSVCVGGKKLARNRHYLHDCGLTQQQWQQKWQAARWFLAADGETGKRYGNETIRVLPQESGHKHCKVRVRLPNTLAHLSNTSGRSPVYELEGTVTWHHRATEWYHRCLAGAAISYNFVFDPSKQAWYLSASWTLPQPTEPVEMLTAAKTVGIDLNSDHLAVFIVDEHGNPTGRPQTFKLLEEGTSPQRRGRLRESIDAALKWAVFQDARVVATEKLDFSRSKALGKQIYRRGQPGKTTRRKVAGLPTAQVFEAVTANAKKHGITHVAVDPAYSSKWGAKYWKPALNQTHRQHASSHHAAAVVISKRSQDHTAKRKNPEPETTRGSSRTIWIPAQPRTTDMPPRNRKGQQRAVPGKDLLAEPAPRRDRHSRSFGASTIEQPSIAQGTVRTTTAGWA